MAALELMFLRPQSLRERSSAWLGLLDDSERARHARLRQAADRLAFVAAHGLLRTVLSRREPSMGPSEWRFSTGPNGKPYLPGSRLSFNLSHCRELVAVAVTDEAAVGVDVEAVDARHATGEVARRVYGPRELADLAAHPQPIERFFERWTIKEAWVKATGEGLSDQLPRFEVRLDAGRGFVLCGDERPWQLHWWTPVAGVKLALCVASEAPLDVTPEEWPLS